MLTSRYLKTFSLYLLLLSLLLSPLFISKSFADKLSGIPLEVTTNFTEIAMPATFWIRLQDVESEEIQAYMLELNKKFLTKLLTAHATRYRILDVWLQFADGHKINPCHVKKGMLDQKSAYFQLSGVLHPADGRVHCKVRYEKSMPLQHIQRVKAFKPGRRATQPGEPKTVTAAHQSYYQALSQCKSGVYKFTQKVKQFFTPVSTVASIFGFDKELCPVSKTQMISDKGGQGSIFSSECKFTKETLSLLVSGAGAESDGDTGAPLSAAEKSLQQALCQECEFRLNGNPVPCVGSFVALLK